MASVTSTMLPLGTEAPPFELPDTAGNAVSISDFKDVPALLVVFMSNHCPYVKHIRESFGDLVRELDHNYPEGGPEAMHDTWNLITRNTQAAVSGLYYWVVESDQGTQMGKFVIIK